MPVRLITPGRNLGYAGALNLGASHSQAEVLIFMNPDVRVGPGCLETLVEALQSGAGVAGPQFFWDEEMTLLMPPTEKRTRSAEALRILAQRGGFWEKSALRSWRRHARHHWLSRDPIQSESLVGALLAVSRATWERAVPFDSSYQLYFEESDWLIRLKRKGVDSIYVPSAKAIHYYNQSASHEPRARQWMDEGSRRFSQLHYGTWFARFASLLSAPCRLPDKVVQLTEGIPEIALSRLDFRPVWIEISSTALGFPAAAVNLSDRFDRWVLPTGVWDRLAGGDYHLRIVGSKDEDLGHWVFTKKGNC